MNHIELSKVSKYYKLEDMNIGAVSDVSLVINRGESVSIVGHSGSGKTTLLSIIGGILKPSVGTVKIDGVDIYSLDEDKLSEYRADKVGYVFQFASLLPVLTATENLLLPTLFRSEPTPEAHKKALDYLALVGLKDKAGALPSQLSGGQQRRVAIARALMNEPEILMADEPTGDLDEATEAEVMSFFQRINRETGVTFVLVTHSSELASQTGRQLRMTGGILQES